MQSNCTINYVGAKLVIKTSGNEKMKVTVMLTEFADGM
jgi:hypothetical protein